MSQVFETQQAVWGETLLTLFEKINHEVYYNINKTLTIPHFEILSIDNNNNLGYWNAEKRIIAINAKLFLYYNEDAVEFILRHEMAHQIVDEIFKNKGNPHGELLKKACKVLGADYHSTVSEKELAQFASDENKVEIVKIKKILAKANCEGSSEKEAASFLKKAQNLIIKYNLSQKDLDHTKKVFLSRPVGKLYKKTPTYYWKIANIVSEHYFVKTIRCQTFVKDEKSKYKYRKKGFGYYMNYYTLFGEPANLDIAEYIFISLEREGEYLWNQFKIKRKAKGLTLKGYSKKSFLIGVFAGFNNKLERAKESFVENLNKDSSNLITLDDPLLKEKYNEAFPDIAYSRTSLSSLKGYKSGFSQGENLRISPGVTSSSPNGKLLN